MVGLRGEGGRAGRSEGSEAVELYTWVMMMVLVAQLLEMRLREGGGRREGADVWTLFDACHAPVHSTSGQSVGVLRRAEGRAGAYVRGTGNQALVASFLFYLALAPDELP